MCVYVQPANEIKHLLRLRVAKPKRERKMPRKKKNAQSPARVPGLSDEVTSSSHPTGGLRGHQPAMASDLTLMSRPQKEEIVNNMREMFSHLDPEVIYIVLSECGFKGSQRC